MSTEHKTTTPSARPHRIHLFTNWASKLHYVFTSSALILVIAWSALSLYGWTPGTNSGTAFSIFAIIIMMCEIGKTVPAAEFPLRVFVHDLLTGTLQLVLFTTTVTILIMQGRLEWKNFPFFLMVVFVFVDLLFVSGLRFAMNRRQMTTTMETDQHPHK